ncbi:hypothetical protein V1514DRAFT_328265 [Lipomyces japonicus]|uniref:uncharacterized protein n=1 Tax=Lipomyces japonicus TaxID=56871 RepID=UPI0034CFCCC1
MKAMLNVDYTALASEWEILHLLIHRNRNQHHQAKWWKFVAIIHRTLKRLLQTPIKCQKKREKKRAKAHGADSRDETLRPGLTLNPTMIRPPNRIELAKKLVYGIIPKAYTAFYRLIAQGQYLQLGLVLIAITAKIWSLLRQDERVFGGDKKTVQVGSDEVGELITRQGRRQNDTLQAEATSQGAQLFDDDDKDDNVVELQDDKNNLSITKTKKDDDSEFKFFS